MKQLPVRKLVAELIGTFWLTFGGIGSVVLWQGEAQATSVALAFGLTVVTMAYAIGHISGAHLNPAVTVGLAMGGRFDWKDVGPYAAAQAVGGILAAALLALLTKNMYGSVAVGANGYKSAFAGFLTEVVLTFMFLIVIMGATSKRAPAQMAGLVIGLCLALIHMIGIPVTGVSVNPARSFGPALFGGKEALKHLWMFLIAPPIGAVGGALAYKWLDE